MLTPGDVINDVSNLKNVTSAELLNIPIIEKYHNESFVSFWIVEKTMSILSNMNIEGHLCRHVVTSTVTSSIWNCFHFDNLHMVFSYTMSNLGYIENREILKNIYIFF